MTTELIGIAALDDLYARGDAVAKRWKECLINNTDVSEIIEECLAGGASFLAAVALSDGMDFSDTCALLACCASNRLVEEQK